LRLGRHVLLVLAVAAGALAVAWPLGLRRLDAVGRGAVLYGAALAVLNAIASHAVVRWSERRSTKTFLRAVLWGTAGRLGVLLLAVAGGVLLLELPELPLTVSLLPLFVVFLFMELVLVHRSLSVPGVGR
jgi:hypothetical protein